ncbi:HesB/IscA family protein [Asticcacaulis machinosus]|uniref:Iron-sulfur cluster assembly accessory protein n=1 Tax=Asticcacaulis machinosus TaxID=2984211 RepID=A0ABT5HFK4_9CAUL|nr:iron-sulfur cluster assembly accessory protein [Asticcacaulis machinosus]MDC7675031.1 iron-sulfur cluster assembly accessory protein [Asticcacaulis machinosus]
MSTSHSISLSAAAARHINTLSAESGHEIMLRVAVEGGGCSGFQYQLDLVDVSEDGDSIISYEGARALVDEVSAPLLSGSIIDYVEELVGSQFKILNPNAKSSCGCGVSFSI